MELFDVSYCNQQLDLLESHYPRKLAKQYIQAAQIFAVIKSMIETPHLQNCLRKMSLLSPLTHTDDEFISELSSRFNSDYDDNPMRNYAISLKRFNAVLQKYRLKLLAILEQVFDHGKLRDLSHQKMTGIILHTKHTIRRFLHERDKACTNAFNLFEVLIEKKKFDKLVYIIQKLESLKIK